MKVFVNETERDGSGMTLDVSAQKTRFMKIGFRKTIGMYREGQAYEGRLLKN